MSKIIISISERDILDLELGNKVWVPVNSNCVVIRTDSTNTVEENDSLNKHTL